MTDELLRRVATQNGRQWSPAFPGGVRAEFVSPGITARESSLEDLLRESADSSRESAAIRAEGVSRAAREMERHGARATTNRAAP